VHCYPGMYLSYLAWALLVLGHRRTRSLCGPRDRGASTNRRTHWQRIEQLLHVYQCIGSTEKIYARTEGSWSTQKVRRARCT
jgi:hypothetical protein